MNTLHQIMPSIYPLGKPARKIHVQYLFGDQDGYIRVQTSKDIELDFMNSGRELQGLPPYTEDDDYENARDNEASWDGN